MSINKKKRGDELDDFEGLVIAPIFSLLSTNQGHPSAEPIATIVSPSSTSPSASTAPSFKERVGNKPSSLSMIRLKKDLPSVTEPQTSGAIVQESPTLTYTTTQLIEAWHQYTRSIKEEIHLYTTMTGSHPEATETEDLFLIKVDSPTQESTLQQAMGDLLEYTRKRLSNHRIRFQIEVVAEKSAHKPFLPSEHFIAMQEKSPAFLHLVQKLGLELK